MPFRRRKARRARAVALVDVEVARYRFLLFHFLIGLLHTDENCLVVSVAKHGPRQGARLSEGHAARQTEVVLQVLLGERLELGQDLDRGVAVELGVSTRFSMTSRVFRARAVYPKSHRFGS